MPPLQLPRLAHSEGKGVVGSSSPTARLELEMDDIVDDDKRRYELCRSAFGFLSGALVLACLTAFMALPMVFFNGQILIPWLQDPTVWFWIETPIVWTSLLGSYLLWGRWSEPSWQRRAGLLVVMCMVDALLWMIKHAHELGIHKEPVAHFWLRMNVGEALGWAEFAILASLACEMMAHLGVSNAEEAGQSTRSLAATGASLFMILFCLRTDWAHGWPLEFRPAFGVPLRLLSLGQLMIQTITLIQVTALVIAATRQCGVMIRSIAQEEASEDIWRGPGNDSGF